MPLPAKAEVADGPVAIATTPPPARLHVVSREVPPGGFFYRILALAERAPRESVVGPFNDTETLWKEVSVRCRANGLGAPTLEDVEDQTCHRLPPGYCRDDAGNKQLEAGAMSLSLADVVNGTRALARWFKNGSVDTEETIRRTMICNACVENVPVAGCQGCAANRLHSVMNAIVVKPLPSDAVLGACRICHCSLKAKVRFRLEDLPALTLEQQAALPEKCWMIAEASLRDSDPRV